MFTSFFLSKNQKLVKKWMKEHEEIVVLAHKVISEYSTHNLKTAKKELIKLNKLAVQHFMIEDIELYKLLKDQGRLDEETKILVEEFKISFQATKVALMDFLSKYTQEDAVLDEEFFRVFNEMVGVILQRISFEEENLYVKLDSK